MLIGTLQLHSCSSAAREKCKTKFRTTENFGQRLKLRLTTLIYSRRDSVVIICLVAYWQAKKSGTMQYIWQTRTYLQVTMNHISRVQVFNCFQQLIHDILLVDVFQYTASFYHIVQVSIYNFFTQCNSLCHASLSRLYIKIHCNTCFSNIECMTYSMVNIIIITRKRVNC